MYCTVHKALASKQMRQTRNRDKELVTEFHPKGRGNVSSISSIANIWNWEMEPCAMKQYDGNIYTVYCKIIILQMFVSKAKSRVTLIILPASVQIWLHHWLFSIFYNHHATSCFVSYSSNITDTFCVVRMKLDSTAYRANTVAVAVYRSNDKPCTVILLCFLQYAVSFITHQVPHVAWLFSLR